MKKKPISARLAKRHAFAGKISKTATGLTKSDLVKNKTGKIVSKKKAGLAKKHFGGWLAAVAKARKALNIKGREYPAPDVGISTSVERRNLYSRNIGIHDE